MTGEMHVPDKWEQTKDFQSEMCFEVDERGRKLRVRLVVQANGWHVSVTKEKRKVFTTKFVVKRDAIKFTQTLLDHHYYH